VGAVTGFPEAVERLERFSPDRMVAQYEEVFECVAGRDVAAA
jgi:hypothetical protein